MSRLTFAVDWDGTCVEDAWPGMGDWNHGAIEALHELTKIGHVLIYTCRIAPVEFGDATKQRPPEYVAAEIAAIRKMLDDVGLHSVTIWTEPYKPPAVEYIDNRARRYLGNRRSWRTLTETLVALYGAAQEVA